MIKLYKVILTNIMENENITSHKFIEEVKSLQKITFNTKENMYESYSLDRETQELDNQNKSTDITLKKTYGCCIIVVLFIWELFVTTFIFVQTLFSVINKMSDTVLITLLTSATANILILPTIVLKYLFPNKKPSNN